MFSIMPDTRECSGKPYKEDSLECYHPVAYKVLEVANYFGNLIKTLGPCSSRGKCTDINILHAVLGIQRYKTVHS